MPGVIATSSACILPIFGIENCSAAERSLVQRAACLTVELENLESHFAQSSGSSVDALAMYSAATNTLVRVLTSLGLKRRARDVTSYRWYTPPRAPPTPIGGLGGNRRGVYHL
jgi:hypothetical protein